MSSATTLLRRIPSVILSAAKDLMPAASGDEVLRCAQDDMGLSAMGQTVIWRDWRSTEAALQAARDDGTSPVLITPEGAASFYGAGYLGALQERAETEFPDVDVRADRRLRRRAGPCAGLPARRREADLDERAQRQDRRHRPADGRRTGKETDMSWQPTRDLVGYGAKPPDPKWPNGARVAVNFVVNYEEGSEPSVQDGEGYSETGLTESSTSSQGLKGRDLAAEGMFEFGSRVGFWRIMRAFQERGLPLTVFGCALALERNKPAAEAIRKSGFDVCCHGWRWVRAFPAERGRGARAHRQGGEVAEADRRRGAGRLVLPLWTQRQHAPPAAGAWRLHLRQRLLRRGAAVLADRRGQAAPDRALLAHQQRRQVRRRHDHLRAVVHPLPRRLRRALQGGRHAPPR